MLTLNLLKLLIAFDQNKFPKMDRVKKMGILGIRIIQFYSTRIDILSEEMCYFLMNIHSTAIDVEPKRMLTIIRKDNSPLPYFEFFDNEPYRCNFVSQIYTGTLKNGQDVVIKFSDPESKAVLLKQLENLRKSTEIISFFFPYLSKKYDLKNIVSEIERISLEKLDLISEMYITNYLDEIRDKYSEKYDLQNLRFSKFHPELSNEEYIISNFKHTDSVKYLLKEIKMKYKHVINIMKYHFFYMFVIGKFHSEAHQGNILVGDDGEIFFIDSNSLSVISDDFRKNFFYFLLRLSEEKLKESFQYFLKLSNTEITEDEKAILYEKFRLNFSRISDKSLGTINLSKKIMSAFKEGIKIGMEFNADLYPILKAIIRLEKIAASTNHTSIFTNDLKFVLKIYEEDENLK
ncbi:MAG: hypothetical protein KA493_05830 [Fusobacteriaceae bacterium]|nr:hypothetical protein [Fusobacteriaceae bacterium]